MAYEDYGYDPMGNTTGYVDQEAQAIALREDEEKKRKEAEERARKENEKLAKERDNLAVHKQEVTTYANGSKTITNVAEIPGTANAPGRPNVKPVAPDDIFQNQLRAESGNRQTDRSGQIMTSPKGALGIAQIMPATAMQPGYGVPDIFTLAQQRGIPVADRSEATARQLLANQALNQEFGQNYSTAMRQRFGDSAGVAAYNAGPGAVERNMGRNQGQFNVAQAPQETQGYLDKVMRGVGNVVNAVIPSAQASTRPQPPANVGSSGFQAYDRNRPGNAAFERAPVAQPFQGQTDEFGGMEEPRIEPVAPQAPGTQPFQGQTNEFGGMEEPRQQEQQFAPNSFDEFGTPVYSAKQAALDTHLKTYESSQNDPTSLMKLGSSDDSTVPDFIKERSRNRAADLITQEREMSRAKETVANASETDIAKYLRKKTEGGSYLKLFLYGLFGMENSGMAEAAKLGIGTDKSIMGSDGKPYIVKTSANGTPLEGFNGETGKRLSAEELIKVAAGTTVAKGVSQDGNIYKDPSGKVKGSFVLETRPGQTPVYKEVGSGRIATAEEGAVLNKTGVAGTLENQLAAQRQKLMEQMRYVEPTKRMEVASKFDQENGTTFAKQLKEEMPEFFGGRPAAPGVTEAAPARAPAQAVPPTPMPPGTTGASQARPGTPVAPGQLPAPVAGRTQADIIAERERQKRESESATSVQTAEQTEYVKETKPAVGQTSSDGQAVSNARRQQLDIIKKNPSVVNILNGQGTQYDQARRIMINAVSGAYGAEEKKQLADDLGQVMNKLTESEQGALTEFVNLNTVVNAKTLRANAGPGAVSDAEQRANKEANVGNVDRIPAYAAMAGLHRSQFNGDLAASKQAFLQANPQIKTTSEFNSAWQKQEALRLKEYQAIAKARFDIMGRAPEMKAGPEAIRAYRDRVFRAFEAYPAPQYDASTNKWNYQTANARRAAMAAVVGQ